MPTALIDIDTINTTVELFGLTGLSDAAMNRTDISVRDSGIHVAGSDYRIGYRVIEHYTLVLVTAGSGTLSWLGHQYPISAGRAFFIYPGVRHAWWTDKEDLLSIAYVGFGGREARDYLEEIAIDFAFPILSVSAEQKEELCGLICEILETLLASVDTVSAWLARSTLWRILALVLEINGDESRLEPSPVSDLVQSAISLLETHYSSTWTMSELARRLSISTSHLHRVFSQEIGMAPHEFLTRTRVAKAKTLLAGTDLQVADVASSVGITDPNYFSRMFRKHAGKPPTAYRTTTRESYAPSD